MPRRATMSIMGMYNAYPEIFNDLHLPFGKPSVDEETHGYPGIDKETLIENLVIELAEMEIIYPNPDILRLAIKRWGDAHYLEWDRLNRSLYFEYNPIHNYDRTEEWTNDETNTSDHETHHLGEMSSSEKTKTAGFNSTELVENGGSENGGNSKSDGTTKGTDTKKSKHSARMFGNIGVTTTDQMIVEYRKTVQFNIYKHIINQFKERFCLLVY